MALVLQDRVKETTTTTGTGTFTLDGTSTGFVGFGVIGNGNETYYTAVDNTTGEWEVGIGTYNAGTLTRDTVLASSNSGNKVPFVAGSKDVFVAYPAEKAVTLDTAQTLANKTLSNANLGTPTAGVLTNATGLPLSTGVTGTLPVGNGGTGATTLTGYVKASGTSAFTAVAAIPGADVSGNISGNAANVTGVVAIANGGTAVTSAPANGQVLIGNGTGYTLATLTAGTGVTITNAPGSITINAPEVGTVTAVTATAPLASSGGNTPDISLTGTVGVSNGGTGATTLTGYVKASGTAAFTAVAQIPNTDISGLGTMSTQNANNVAITGGAIDGTTVGLSTPSSGAFTTLTASGASITSINSGVALLTTATITNLTATSASIASANVGTAVVTTGSVGNLTVTGASIASANVGVALVTTGTVNNLTATGASVASANLGVAVITTGTVGNLTATSASVASANAAVALITTGTVTNLTATSASIASANVATAVVTGLTVTNASIASANAGTATITTGNLTFSATGQRITGDFSNPTFANRVVFQTSTANNPTSITVIPNGSSTTGDFFAFNNSDTTNAGLIVLRAASGETTIRSGITGTGTFLPMTFYTGGSERMRLDTSGNLGIGGTAAAANKVEIAGTLPSSSNNSFGFYTGAVIPSTTTSSAQIFRSAVTTQAASFTLSDLSHFRAGVPGGSFGAGSTVTTQYGFHAQDNLTGATNNYGFYSNIASGSNRWNFFANGTADNYFAGNVGIGIGVPSCKLHLVGSVDTTFAPNVFNQRLTGTSSATSGNAGSGISFAGYTTGTSTVSDLAFISGIKQNTTDGNYDGALVFGTRTNGSGGGSFERMRIDASGNVGIGGTASATDKVTITGTLPSSSNFSLGNVIRATIPSTSTSGCYGFATAINTQAASFTTAAIRHFSAEQGTLGAGSAVTNQYGFVASSNLTGATNNYGFYSDIASGSNRWNFYAAGTAANYFAGNVAIGTTSASTKLNVAGTNDVLHFNNPSGTSIYQRWFNTGVTYSPYIGTEDENIVFGHWGLTERMRITSGGEVYIAGTTDQGAYNLQCNGTGVWGAGAYVNGSDARLKDNIQSLDAGLDVVKAMRPVTFQYKPEYSKDQSVQPGFIAQELQEAMAGKPYLEGVVQEGPNHLNVAYQGIIPILVKAIQELEAKVAALEAK